MVILATYCPAGMSATSISAVREWAAQRFYFSVYVSECVDLISRIRSDDSSSIAAVSIGAGILISASFGAEGCLRLSSRHPASSRAVAATAAGRITCVVKVLIICRTIRPSK